MKPSCSRSFASSAAFWPSRAVAARDKRAVISSWLGLVMGFAGASCLSKRETVLVHAAVFYFDYNYSVGRCCTGVQGRVRVKKQSAREVTLRHSEHGSGVSLPESLCHHVLFFRVYKSARAKVRRFRRALTNEENQGQGNTVPRRKVAGVPSSTANISGCRSRQAASNPPSLCKYS